MKKSKFVVKYVGDHKKSFILFMAMFLLNLCLCYLYHAPAELPFYWLVLCLLFAGLVVGADFLKYIRKSRILEGMKKEVLYSQENLPVAESLEEEVYQELLEIFDQEVHRLRTEEGKSQQEMMDYYTLWVHQIKTPIAAMKLILQDAEDEKSRELSMQLFSIEQYVELVLQYIRLESIDSDYDFKENQLDIMVRQSVRKYAPLFIRKRLSLNYEPLNCQVLTDEKWFCFVLEQILSNAVKYTEKGSVSIYLEKGEKKILVIEDTGIGIAPEDLPRICEKNFTGYNGRRDKKASGLGLYLSRKVLENLGHGFKIESEPGKGTRVRVFLDAISVEYE